jgi:sterol desaturase/sphingolipid hydroxylase (fatty acid hydroxylase superfamily)
MFKHDLFEFFGATKWWVIPLVWLPVIAYLSSSSLGYFSLRSAPYAAITLPSFAALSALGVGLWTLLEYLLHRYLFHVLFSRTSELFISFHFLLHGQHHKFPLDEGRLVFPPVSGFMVATPVYLAYHSTLAFASAEAVMAGTLAGYVVYDLLHYYLHHGHPTVPYLRDLKCYHREHHYRNPDLGMVCCLW